MEVHSCWCNKTNRRAVSSRPTPPVTRAPGWHGDRIWARLRQMQQVVSLMCARSFAAGKGRNAVKRLMGNQAGPPGCWGCCLPATTQKRKPSQALSTFLLWTQPCLLRSISFTCTHESTHQEQRVCFHRRYTSHIFLLLFVCACVRVSVPREKLRNDLTFQEPLSRKLQKIKHSADNQVSIVRNILGNFWAHSTE